MRVGRARGAGGTVVHATRVVAASHQNLSGRSSSGGSGPMMSNNALRSAIAAVLGVFAAAAQAAPTSGLEEVVVTAQRRSEAIQDVPIAVTALSNTQLERLNVTETLDLIKLIPNAFGSNNT